MPEYVVDTDVTKQIDCTTVPITASFKPVVIEIKIKNETRFVIIDSITGEIIDDANSYGYKSELNAKKAMRWKYDENVKKSRDEASKFWKENPKLKKLIRKTLDNYAVDMVKGEYTFEELILQIESEHKVKIDRKFLKLLLKI